MTEKTNFFIDLYKSLKTTGGDGFSGRKLTALSIMVLIAYVHFKFVDKDIAVAVIGLDYIAVFLMMGLITASQFIRLKEGPSGSPIPETTITTETITETKINP